MFYYNENDDYDFYDEPDEVTVAAEAFKESVRSSVKKEILDELERLRQENKELQEFKEAKESFLSAQRQEIQNLMFKHNREIADLKRKRAAEILKDVYPEGYVVICDYSNFPKCDKCDSYRRIKYRTPLGREATESCTCGESWRRYRYERRTCISLKSRRRDYSSGSDTTVYAVFDFSKNPDEFESTKIVTQFCDDLSFDSILEVDRAYYQGIIFNSEDKAAAFIERYNAESEYNARVNANYWTGWSDEIYKKYHPDTEAEEM